MFFGKGVAPSHLTKLDGVAIPWETKWIYLGITLKSNVHFDCCVKEILGKFFRSLNSILRIEGQSDDMVKLRLLEAHCLPILTYGIEILRVADGNEWRQMRVAYNSIYRKIFNYTRRESVTVLQHSLNRPTWEELRETRKTNFLLRCTNCSRDSLVRTLASPLQWLHNNRIIYS